MTETKPLLQVESLSIAYGDTEALHGVSFDLAPGRCVAVVGESGSGKTTLAKAILGLLPPTARIRSGRVVWDGGLDLLTAPRERRRLLGRELSYIPQSPLLSFDPLTAIGRQAVEPLEIHGLLDGPWPDAAAGLLASVAIDRPRLRARQHSFELSGGMLQRVLIASALSSGPRLVLADEPTASLDMLSQETVLELIDDQISRRGAALLLITHDLGMALDRADSVVVMRNGRVVESGDITGIVRSPGAEYSRQLLSHVKRSTGVAGVRSRPAELAAEDGSRPVPTLEVRRLSKTFEAPDGENPDDTGSPEGGAVRRAGAHSISFRIPRGRTLVLVGESGSGKSTVANMIVGQLTPDSGEILLEGQPIDPGHRWVAEKTWQKVQLIHQDSLSTFDPRYTVSQVVSEPLRNLRTLANADIPTRVAELLEVVGLNPDLAGRVARSLSGGQAQRLAIARALAVNPRLLLLDEAVSALDVLVRERILELLRRLQKEFGLSYLFITHDLSVASEIADEILVMRAGHVVERGDPDTIYNHPADAYTRRLIGAIPGQKFLASLNPDPVGSESIAAPEPA